MKQTDMIVLALAGVAVYLIVKTQRAPGGQAAAGGGVAAGLGDMVREIFGEGGERFGNGWRYFDNGTAISPTGDYYFQGQLVYRAGG